MSEDQNILFNHSTDILIYSDGACSGNPGPGGWASIVFFDQQVTELSGRQQSTTNNRMEMTAVLEALRVVVARKMASIKIFVYTDSTYLINGIEKWVWGWIRNHWKTKEGSEVSNADLWKTLHSLVNGQLAKKIEFRYCRGHKGHIGNERCDELAVMESKNMSARLFSGSLSSYAYKILPPPPFEAVPAPKGLGEKKAPAFGYLSYVDGRLMLHKNWSACEHLVKGRSGARFKKAQNESEVNEIIKSWGLDPKQISLQKEQ